MQSKTLQPTGNKCVVAHIKNSVQTILCEFFKSNIVPIQFHYAHS